MIGQYLVGEASLLSGLKYKYFHIRYIVFQVLFGHIVYWIFYAFLIEIRQYLFFIKTKTRLNQLGKSQYILPKNVGMCFKILFAQAFLIIFLLQFQCVVFCEVKRLADKGRCPRSIFLSKSSFIYPSVHLCILYTCSKATKIIIMQRNYFINHKLKLIDRLSVK